MVGTKKQTFWPRINKLKWKKRYILLMNYSSTKSAKITHSKSIFDVKNQQNLKIKFFIEEYQFRRPFFGKNIFSSVSFWTTLLLKSCQIFDELTYIDRIKKKDPWSLLILGQKSCFLRPTISQPNWYYGAYYAHPSNLLL